MKPTLPSCLAILLLLCSGQGSALPAQAPIEERVPRFVNRDRTSPESRVDWVRRADRPFPLREPSRPFSVTYVHGGDTYTLEDYLRRADVLGFLVLKDDRIVFEDQRHGTGPEDRYLSMSVSKSIVAVLVGIAVDEGRIRSVEDPVTQYLPYLVASGYRDATVRDVLQMATGVEFSEEYGNATSGIGELSRANRTGMPTFAEFAASLPAANPPGTVFRYQSVNTQVLALLLEAATGIPLNRYLEEKLWRPIGAQNDAFFLTGERQPGICAYGCFYASLRDYGRFGLMALRWGELGGSRIVSEAWIKASATPPPYAEPSWTGPDGSCRRGYGYQWWIPCDAGGAFQAVGINGQAIYVDPENGVVIAQFSAWPQTGAPPERRGEDIALFRAIVQALRE